jgi:copper(I)-binding protein
MKKQILASLVIASLSAGAFALPQVSVEQSNAPAVAADGADRVGTNRIAADGSDRVGINRIAADGADRVGINRIA